MPTTYYKVDGRRIRVREYWRWCPGWVNFLVAVAAKPFGGLPFRFVIIRPDELRRLGRPDVPDEAVRRLQDSCAAFETAGLTFHFYHAIPNVERDRLGIAAVHLSADGRTAGMALYGRLGENWVVEGTCASWFIDGSFGSTTTQRPMLDPDPAGVVARHPGLAANDLFARHVGHLGRWGAAGRVTRSLTAATLPGFVLAGEQAAVDVHVRRGVYVPITAAELRDWRTDGAGDSVVG